MIHEFDPGLVITDVRMPGMSGLDLLASIRRLAPAVDVVASVTAFEDMATAVAAMKAGALEYLVKPLDLDRIEILVERCFKDRSARRRAERTCAARVRVGGAVRNLGADRPQPAHDRSLQDGRGGR